MTPEEVTEKLYDSFKFSMGQQLSSEEEILIARLRRSGASLDRAIILIMKTS
jgi:hypothetical protein